MYEIQGYDKCGASRIGEILNDLKYAINIHRANVNRTLAFMGVAALCIPGNGIAADFSSTGVDVLYGTDYELGSNGDDGTDAVTLTFEHFSTWTYGDNYFFFDAVFESNGDENTRVYGEYYPRISIGKVTGHDLSANVAEGLGFQDVSLSVGVNAGNDVRILTYGPSWNFNIPGFTFFQLDTYAYDDVSDSNLDTTYQITPSWSMPFEVQGLKFEFRGFVDFIGDQGSGTEPQIVAQPQLRLDLGDLIFNSPGQLTLGTEFSWWHNKFGVDGVTDNVWQALVGYRF
ncbi:DUF5020 family protein [Ferruginivarius sediminum]|uniref:DUF5020 family protein n=1 Tax=Ferruginivarius sediminum TaxID=2661937 RepID=A0A369TCE4_9PROT|nr:DUF5020 family protein [Ferruginivarius sediminum]RDD62194.1 DUF5020 family protein [Ferruginivarius sediminum]